jgi:ABC-2 type transport system ATP-binding protein
MAVARMEALDIPLKRKVKALSGGQQAQVSLAMALAKRAPLLVLDEPVASLDPIARLEFMREVMAQVADGGPTVIIASHVVGELERFCDWLVVLTHGHVQLAGSVDDLLHEHRLLTVPRAISDADLPGTPIHRADSDRHSTVVLRTGQVPAPGQSHSDWRAEAVGFEQLVLAYLQRPARAPDFPSPTREAEPPGPTTKVMSR